MINTACQECRPRDISDLGCVSSIANLHPEEINLRIRFHVQFDWLCMHDDHDEEDKGDHDDVLRKTCRRRWELASFFLLVDTSFELWATADGRGQKDKGAVSQAARR